MRGHLQNHHAEGNRKDDGVICPKCGEDVYSVKGERRPDGLQFTWYQHLSYWCHGLEAATPAMEIDYENIVS